METLKGWGRGVKTLTTKKTWGGRKRKEEEESEWVQERSVQKRIY